MGDHKLHTLWNKARIVLEGILPDNDKDILIKAERIILEIHKIDTSGQNFRYSRDKQGNSTTEKLPESVNLEALKKTCDGLFKFLDDCDTGLCACIDAQNSMTDNY